MKKLRTPAFVLVVVVVISVLAAPYARAQQPALDKQVPVSSSEVELSFAPLVKRVTPAVVNIYTKRVVRQGRRSPFFNDPLFRQFFGDQFSFGQPRERIQNSLGSGVIVRSDGVIVTNNHVIAKAEQITVVLSDRRELDARVVIADERTDLAVLRVDTKGEALPFLKIRDSDELEVGDLVLAIGNPFGVGQTVTSGIVSALARAAKGVSDFSFFIQTDAAINPGNSGGALVSLDGQLVGINTAIYTKSGGSAGIGFAIPSNMVSTVVESGIKGVKVVRPWFGAGGQLVTTDLAQNLGLKRPSGVIISRIYPDSPAARAGLRVGDVVVAINGREVVDARGLRFRIATLQIGGTARLEVFRRGERQALTLSLRPAPEDPPRRITSLRGDHPLAGAIVANLSPKLADELSLDMFMTGVIVLKINRPSAARSIGMRPGDVIVRVNQKATATVTALSGLLKQKNQQWRISVRRNNKVLTVVVGG